MDAVGRGEQQQEHDLQQGEGGVCGEEEGGRGAGDEDGLPEVGEEVGHGCCCWGLCGVRSFACVWEVEGWWGVLRVDVWRRTWEGGVVCLLDKVLYGYGVGCGRQAVFGIGRRMGFGPRY